MTQVYLNRIGTAVPEHDIHMRRFVAFARTLLLADEKERGCVRSHVCPLRASRIGFRIFRPGDIDGRRSGCGWVFQPRPVSPIPAARMGLYAARALGSGAATPSRVLDIAAERDSHHASRGRVLHRASPHPGLDLHLAEQLGLKPIGRAHPGRFHGVLGGGACVKRLAQQAVQADLGSARAGDQSRIIVAAYAGNRRYRDIAVVDAVRRWLCGRSGHGRCGRYRVAGIPHRRDTR